MEKKHNLDGEIPANFSGSTWMKDLDDYQLLTEISIPGTHNSATFGAYDWVNIARCQMTTSDFKAQLSDGIRFFDLRVGSDGNLHHSSVVCYESDDKKRPVTIEMVIRTMREFLDSHPDETIILVVKHEYGNDKSSYRSYVQNAIKNWGRVVYASKPAVPIGYLRSKIVLLDGGGDLGWKNVSAMHGGGWGIKDGIYWQNEYDIGNWTEWAETRAELKAEAIKEFNNKVVETKDPELFCFNWWNKAYNVGTSVKEYADMIKSYFTKKRNYYPQGVQIMDYYNAWLVYEVIKSNRFL